MKLLIASDIHGSAHWCRRMLEYFDKVQPERLLLLGDLLYHGPRNDLPDDYAPKEVAAMLNTYKNRLLCVRGNCEAEVDQMMLEFPVLSESAILFTDGHVLHAAHGHKCNAETPPPHCAGDILLCGHTHIPVFTQNADFTFCNPGSVAIPKGGSCHSCVLWEDGCIRFIDLSDFSVVREEHI